ncbi:N-carbamoylsarcosine amidohydrolase [Pseudaminobacter salicylatoxidans]|uniref:N-carbamoylsarcosine amidohydrolase n=1 Tax=Pseudaminobacter salicylatoxidans TaxID=93369 RepID=UPI0003078973|nr:N-carbamoylsarcosine amidohydrolase [Pseudaminobacter salicylatoxidans]
MQDVSTNYRGVWGGRVGFGSRPAVIAVDFVKAYTIPGAALYAPGVIDAVAKAPLLLTAARERQIPVIHTRILYSAENCADGGMWVQKAPVMKAMVAGNEQAEFCDEVKPTEGEPVIVKQYASAFFGTSLASQLHAAGIDTVVLAGCSTSGCIRATAVDAVQHGFRTIVVRDCVGDRHPDPHEANLFDIDSKYGDVVSLDEAIAALGEDRESSR